MSRGIAMLAAMMMAVAEGKQCYGDVYRSNRRRSAEKNFRLACMAQTIRRKEESKELRTFNIGGEKSRRILGKMPYRDLSIESDEQASIIS